VERFIDFNVKDFPRVATQRGEILRSSPKIRTINKFLFPI